MSEGKAEAEAYLSSLLNKNLRINTTDGRMFVGQFRCTDAVSLASISIPPFTLASLLFYYISSILTLAQRTAT
jgi:hypothetical protein